MGRNIWQSEHPAAMIQAIHGIVKNRLNVKEALELYDDVKTKIIDRLLHLNKCKINIYHNKKSPYVTYGLSFILIISNLVRSLQIAYVPNNLTTFTKRTVMPLKSYLSNTRNDAVFQAPTVDQSLWRPVAIAASSTADAASVA